MIVAANEVTCNAKEKDGPSGQDGNCVDRGVRDVRTRDGSIANHESIDAILQMIVVVGTYRARVATVATPTACRRCVASPA